MRRAIEKLKATSEQSRARAQQSEKRDRSKQAAGLVAWNELVEWVEKCCASAKDEIDLQFKRLKEHEFAVVFETDCVMTLKVTFDMHGCTIKYSVTSSSTVHNMIVEKVEKLRDAYRGTFDPTVTGNGVVHRRDGKRMSIDEMGEFLIERLGEPYQTSD